MRVYTSCALMGLCFLAALDFSACLQTVVTAASGPTVNVQRKLESCTVCTVSGVNDTDVNCHPSLTLEPDVELKLLFNCEEGSYTVTIDRTIECTKDTCSPTTLETQPSLLTEFSRTFTWALKAPEKTVMSLDVLDNKGLIESSESCSNGFQFSVDIPKTSGQDKTLYCRGGSVARLDLSNEAIVSLLVEPNTLVDSVLFQASAGPIKGQTVVVTIDPSTTVVLSRDVQEPECEICTPAAGSNPDCSSKKKMLTNVENLSVEFSCSNPEGVFSVTVTEKIECTQMSCSPAVAKVNSSLFKDFKRSFLWNISVPDKTVITLNFPADGLKVVPATEGCEDGHQYSVSTKKNNGKIKRSGYCRGGTVSRLDLLGTTSVTFDVPKGSDMDGTAFSVGAAARAGRLLSVTPDPDTIIIINRMNQEPDCSVCMDQPPNQVCSDNFLQLRDLRNTTVEFTCPRPQDVFNVEINREIDCTEISCSGNIVQAETLLFPDFNRTFTWDLKVVATRAFQLDFPELGMRQIPNEETCPSDHTYSVIIYLRTGPATVGTFCKGGPITTILARYKGRMVLHVPGDGKLDPVDFKLNVGPETNMLAIMKVNLPRGVSDTEFPSPNFPGDFPDLQQMQWDFNVPSMHNYTVHFMDHTEPECLEGDVMVEYQKEAQKATILSLTDPQPKHQQGDFSLVLKNCETNRTLQGLALNYKVSVMRSGHPVLCTVDLTKHKALSVEVQNLGSALDCEVSVDAAVQDKIKVAAGSAARLSFLDCTDDDLRLTASEVIGCPTVGSCVPSVLTVPTLDSCLWMPLHSFTWHVRIPQNGTVDLVSPTGTLKQSLQGQACSHPALHVAEEDGFSVGDFCSNGPIQKVQVHSNVSVTASGQDFTKNKGPFLNVSMSQEIRETIIYKVSPTTMSPTLLATPNWPQGMKPSSTISWMVTLPSQYKAQLQFVNVSQPKCVDQHTAITVKMLGQEEEMMSRQEDEKAEDLMVPGSFYLNMSNCIPEQENFGAVAKIVLEKKINILAIVLGVLGALILLAIIVAVVIVVMKKKKSKKNKEASIYIGKGSLFRPGDGHFPKARSNNESHVYDSIDEMMVYGHLLRDSSYSGSIQDHFNGKPMDTYHTFTGPTDGTLPVIAEPDPEPEMDGFNTFLNPAESFMPPRPRTPINRQDSLGFQDSRMVDNELYTFKSTGDFNTIRLSADLDAQPSVLEETL
uniref:CUB domain-containing protein 1-like n=2 Tax=Gouania willdenowi TaxID=441366 RepID=A0A8C5GCQ0_GOUWI